MPTDGSDNSERIAPRTSDMAVASLILSILGFTSPIGLVLGMVALRRIDASGGYLRGRGVAIGAISVGGAYLLGLVVVVLGVVPAQAKLRGLDEAARACRDNQRQLAVALLMYTQDWGGRFPPADAWCDAATLYTHTGEAFRCPLRGPTGDCSFTYSPALHGARLGYVANPREMAMLWDGNGGWNVCGGLASVDFRHGKGANFTFADGRCEWRSKARASGLWDSGAGPRLPR